MWHFHFTFADIINRSFTCVNCIITFTYEMTSYWLLFCWFNGGVSLEVMRRSRSIFHHQNRWNCLRYFAEWVQINKTIMETVWQSERKNHTGAAGNLCEANEYKRKLFCTITCRQLTCMENRDIRGYFSGLNLTFSRFLSALTFFIASSRPFLLVPCFSTAAFIMLSVYQHHVCCML